MSLVARLLSRTFPEFDDKILPESNTLQRTATHYSTLQHTDTHCNTLQHTAPHCNTLQHTATHLNCQQGAELLMMRYFGRKLGVSICAVARFLCRRGWRQDI